MNGKYIRRYIVVENKIMYEWIKEEEVIFIILVSIILFYLCNYLFLI